MWRGLGKSDKQSLQISGQGFSSVTASHWRLLSRAVMCVFIDYYGYYHNTQEVKMAAGGLARSLLLWFKLKVVVTQIRVVAEQNPGSGQIPRILIS